jgi:hypothetical protein
LSFTFGSSAFLGISNIVAPSDFSWRSASRSHPHKESPADELVVFSTRRVAKNRNARRDAALHEIRRFERPRAAGMKR